MKERLPYAMVGLLIVARFFALPPGIAVEGNQQEINVPERSSEEAKRNPVNAKSSFDMYPGTEAILFASEPRMLSPTNLDVDYRGRVWVCEVANYREHAENNPRSGGDRILILEDLDGDGVADTSHVYYQGRDIDAALGICVLGNTVIVTCAPNVIVFTDQDGDDVPDRKEYLFTKSGAPQDDHSTHSIVFGPDGKFYWNMGNHGRVIHDQHGEIVIDQEGRPVIDQDEIEESPYAGQRSGHWGGMVFRFDPDGSNFEVLAHNFRNNYEAAVDSLGNVWQSDNDDDGNYGVRLNYVMEYGNYGYRDELTGNGWRAPRTGQHPEIPMRHWHQNDPGVVPNLVYTGAGSPTGITVYEGRLLPEAFWDRVLACDAGPGVVWSPQAKKAGAGYTGEMETLMKAPRDRWFRPVDCAVAPDGALYVSDWYDPVVGWNRQADRGRGRIFRVAPPGHRSRMPEFDFATAAGAVAALTSPNQDARYQAWTALHGMGRAAEPALLKLYESDNLRHRARALWLLSKIEGRGETHIRSALKAAEEDIRIVALRAARQVLTDMQPIVRELVHDPSPQVRRECAIALRSHSLSEGAALWVDLAKQHDGQDRWYLEALGIAAEGRWDEYLPAWLAAVGSDWNTPAGRDIVWRSRAEITPHYLARILNSQDVDKEASKRYMRAFDFQEDGPTTKGALRQLVLDGSIADASKRTFVATQALLRLEDFDIRETPDILAKVSRLIRDAQGTPEFVRLVRRYRLEAFYPSLMAVALENKDTPTGITAIRMLLDAGNDEIVSETLRGDEIQAALSAVEVLGNSRHDRALEMLRRAILDADLSWRVREHAVRSMIRADFRWVLKMAQRGEFPETLKEVAGAAMTASLQVSLVDQAREFFPIPPLRSEDDLPQMTELLVHVGDIGRGKEVFTAATCVQCHIVNGEGTNFGPDLSQIGAKLSKQGLYESILDPSAGVSPTYQSYTLELQDGQEWTGFIESETPSHITLRMAGGAVVEIDRADVVERSAGSLSAMPAGLQQVMSTDDLIDLIEYLVSLK